MRALRLVALLAALALALVPAPAALGATPRTTLPDVEDEVMCTQCGTALNISEAPSADRERAFIRAQIAQGKTKEQIKQALKAEYGARVLAVPSRGGFDRAAFLVPALLGLLALGGVGFAAMRWRRGRGEEIAPSGPGLDPADARRLDAELRTFKGVSGGVDTTVVAAFAVGLVSFVSPCVLPLVPGYLSAVSGVPVTDMRSGERPVSRVLLPAIAFCGAFTLVFVALGMTATGLGSTLNDHRGALEKGAGAVIVVLGLFFVLTPFVPRLNREWRVDALMTRAGSGGPLVAGAAFAIAWTPCVGPTLATILSAAALQQTVGEGAILLTFYSLGLAVPFLLTAVAFNRATTASRWLRDRYLIITAISGLVLVVMGLLLLTGQLTDLNTEAQRLLRGVGLDNLYDL